MMFNELSRKNTEVFREGSEQTESGFYWSRCMDWQDKEQDMIQAQRSEWSSVVKAMGSMGGEGRWDRVWDRLDLETHPKCATFEAQIWPSGSYPYLHGHPEREPRHLFTLEFCDYRWERVLQSLSACTDGILTAIWERPTLITVKKLIPTKLLCW